MKFYGMCLSLLLVSSIHSAETMPYCDHSSCVILGSARQSQIVAERSEQARPLLNSKASEKERFGKVAASPNSQNLSDRSITPTEAWQRLKDGNQRFISGKRNYSINYMVELEKSKQKQTPYAAILSCSDSRLPPELIFDESLGKLFVMRVAGNIASDITIGSIEYAVAILKVPIVVVLGHDSCGVLVAGLKEQQAALPPFINDLLNEVSRSVAETKQKSKDFSIELPMAISRNAQLQLQELLEKSQVLRQAAESNRTLFKAGVFHFSGQIEWLP